MNQHNFENFLTTNETIYTLPNSYIIEPLTCVVKCKKCQYNFKIYYIGNYSDIIHLIKCPVCTDKPHNHNYNFPTITDYDKTKTIQKTELQQIQYDINNLFNKNLVPDWLIEHDLSNINYSKPSVINKLFFGTKLIINPIINYIFVIAIIGSLFNISYSLWLHYKWDFILPVIFLSITGGLNYKFNNDI